MIWQPKGQECVLNRFKIKYKKFLNRILSGYFNKVYFRVTSIGLSTLLLKFLKL